MSPKRSDADTGDATSLHVSAQLHQRIHQVCAELGAAFQPTLTVVDATRILTGGGPTGGSLALVQELDQIAVSTDPVAADAWGGSLLDRGVEDLPQRRLGVRGEHPVQKSTT